MTKEQEQWAFKNCLEHIGYRTKSNVFCLDCGNIWDGDKKAKNMVCPACGIKLRIVDTKKKKFSQTKNKMAIVDVVDGFQVIRHFEIWSHHRAGEKARQMTHEIVQQWFTPDLNETIVGRVQFIGNESYTGDMEIRGSGRSWRGTNYYPWTHFVYPKFNCLPIYKRNGFTSRVSDIDLLTLFKKLIHDNISETLIKARQFDLLSCRVGNREHQVYKFWNSIKIAIRNNYKVKDGLTWLDYLELASYFKQDLHNPKYVCPRNLKDEHDILVKRKQEITRVEDEARAARNAILQERNAARSAEIKHIKDEMDSSKYIQEKGRFFGLLFTDGDLSIRVLKTLEEFKQEGKIHTHCVFTNNYFSLEDSLIFSASVNGIPAETIELSLSKMQIMQSRGFDNKPTPYHDQIINLVNKNLNLIRRCLKPMKVKRVLQERVGAVA
ncbi:PcfJ domain-containing protein [Pedobacter nototheniae]|uniref:PcfJ domain-containing protein n=1 Tax=Pedobacter nototheniae TaxID=2488994 RepID=UPI0013F4442C|nr:PcfJ domain-containing protein [Pedobacter nototheniae]